MKQIPFKDINCYYRYPINPFKRSPDIIGYWVIYQKKGWFSWKWHHIKHFKYDKDAAFDFTMNAQELGYIEIED